MITTEQQAEHLIQTSSRFLCGLSGEGMTLDDLRFIVANPLSHPSLVRKAIHMIAEATARALSDGRSVR
jgi:hypothetical protein